MKLEILPGRYVVAVSGGVDSVALLDLLRLHPGVRLTVAHYDHGIREDSAADRAFVRALAHRYRLPFVYDAGNLGAGASEAEAREARYAFLQRAKKASGADALITAHHQDDVLETVIINLLRGTGRKGLSSLTNGEGIIRPLLGVPKSEIIDYAKRHRLLWREDSTNASDDYLRNRIRHAMLPRLSSAQKEEMLDISRRMQGVNRELDELLARAVEAELAREWFIGLPHDVAREVMATWLRLHGVGEFNTAALERLAVAGKTAAPGKSIDIAQGRRMLVGNDFLALGGSER